jgi:hypothetical protein
MFRSPFPSAFDPEGTYPLILMVRGGDPQEVSDGLDTWAVTPQIAYGSMVFQYGKWLLWWLREGGSDVR